MCPPLLIEGNAIVKSKLCGAQLYASRGGLYRALRLLTRFLVHWLHDKYSRQPPHLRFCFLISNLYDMNLNNIPQIQCLGDYAAHKGQSVFVFRVAAHTLGRQLVDAKSENHISIYLLLGNNRSFHLDMKPVAGRGNNVGTIGQLTLQGRPYHRSNSVITYTDLKARGCPDSFSPVQQPPTSSASRVTVEQFVEFVIQNRLHYFRYALTDGHSVGCRLWA